MCRTLALLVFIGFGGIVQAAEPAADVRATIDKGLEFLADKGIDWKEDRKCGSCHHTPMTLWSLNEAKQAGYKVDEQVLAELTTWVLADDDPAKIFPKQAPQPEIIVNQSPLLLSLGISAGKIAPEATRKGLAKMFAAVIEKQQPDGSWKLSNPWEPIGSTPEVMTTFALLSLNLPTSADLGEAAKSARDKGLAWLTARRTDSLQSSASKLLLWRRLARPEPEWQPMLKDVLGRQNPDGGWSQIKDLPSDAFSTGQVLDVLAEAGLTAQDAEGSWTMTSNPNPRDGKSAKSVAPISYAGTAWAVMGLVRSAPLKDKPVASQ
ncbi:MAG: hypothetical protein K8R36_12295 [Planctomycetales bacterium]|nr:hypothetical protein [Planctomycetales bacterium]